MDAAQTAETIAAYLTMDEGPQKEELGEQISQMTRTEITPAFIQLMKHRDPSLRCEAINALQLIAQTMTLEIVAALAEVARTDDDECCRAAAILALREHGERYNGRADLYEQILSLTIHALSDPHAKVREAAASALSYSHLRAVPALIRALEDTEDEVRIVAAHTLGTLRAPQVIDALARVYTSDTNDTARHTALQSLTEFDYDCVIPYLLQALRDPDARIRRLAASDLDERKYLSEAFYRAWEAMDGGAVDSTSATVLAEEEFVEDALASGQDFANVQADDTSCASPLSDGSEMDAIAADPMLCETVDGHFSSLCDTLESADVEAQKKAIRALEASQDERAIPFLLNAILSDNAEISALTYAAIGSFNQPLVNEHLLLRPRSIAAQLPATAAPLLENLIRDDELDVEKKADLIAALCDNTAPHIGHLFLIALESESARVREAAAKAFIENPDPAALQPLMNALHDESENVREAAVGALSEVAGNRAIAPLCELLQTEDHFMVCREIIWALGRMDDPRAADAIRECVDSENHHLRQIAMETLGRKSADDVFQTAMHDLQSTDDKARSDAIYNLSDIYDRLDKDKQFEVYVLFFSLDNDPVVSVVRATAHGLGTLQTGRALRRLLKLADHPCSDIKEQALTELCEINDKRALKRVLAALANDEDPDIRNRIARSLCNYLSTPEIRKALKAALANEKNLDTQYCIRNALKQYDDNASESADDDGDKATTWLSWLGRTIERLRPLRHH